MSLLLGRPPVIADPEAEAHPTIRVAAPVPQRREPRRRDPAATALLAALAVLAVSSFILGGFLTAVQQRAPRSAYASPLLGQSWIRSESEGPRAFFRFEVPVTSLPETATLWVQGDQAVTPYLDGFQLAATPKLPPTSDMPKQVESVDLLPGLVRGANTVGVQAVNLADNPPAFEARIVLGYGERDVVLGTGPQGWISTTDVALTGESFPDTGTFSDPGLATSGWEPARAAQPWPGATDVAVAPLAYTMVPVRPALAGAAGDDQLTATTTLRLSSPCEDGWLRVAATGSYTVSLDGQVVAEDLGDIVPFGVHSSLAPPPGPAARDVPLAVFDLCPLLSAGTTTLSISVSAAVSAVVYADGLVRSGAVVTTFGTGHGWVAPGGGVLRLVDAPVVAFHHDFDVVPGTLDVPASWTAERELHDALLVLAVLGAAIALATALGARLRRAICAVLLGSLPAAGLVLVLDQVKHLAYTQPPFPATPALLDVVAALLLAGSAAAVVVAAAGERGARRGPRRARRRPPTAVVQPAVVQPAAVQPAAIQPASVQPASVQPASVQPASVQPASVRSRLVGRLAARVDRVALCAVTAVMVVVLSFQLGFEPLWQDELDSIIAAQGIREHLLPIWPSGFQYWKAELYSATIAALGVVTHNSVVADRALSVVFFAATVLLVSFVVLELVMPQQRVLRAATGIALAIAPAESQFARDVRMYQMVQFFVVLVAVLLLRAIERPDSRRVAAAMAAVVAMYLTHEESFGVLPLIPLLLCALSGRSWLSNWRWWLFGGLAGSVIGVQLLLAKLTHPPSLGVDASGGPLIAWSPQPFFYLQIFFFTPGNGGGITLVSWLALLGVVNGVRRKLRARLYLAAFWIVPVATVSLILPTKNARYVFLCLPFVFVLAGCGVADLVGGLVSLRRRLAGGARLVAWERTIGAAAGLLSFLAVTTSFYNGLPDLGPIAGRLFGADIVHYQGDYDRADAYVKAHLEPGDAVIAASPGNLVASGIGRPPTYWMAYYSDQVLLYVIEKNGQAVDTQYGVPVILDDDDFVRDVDAHPRVWLVISDRDVEFGLPPDEQATLAARFRLVENGEDTAVYLATNYPATQALTVARALSATPLAARSRRWTGSACQGPPAC